MNDIEFENKVFDVIVSDIKFIVGNSKKSKQQDLWSSRMELSLKKFINSDNTINKTFTRNFRKNKAFVAESPSFKLLNPINWIRGSFRGERRDGRDRFKMLVNTGDIEKLKKYPLNRIGNPYYFKKGLYTFNERSSRHVRYINLISKNLDSFFSSKKAVVLDIGSSYGIFPELLKKEYSNVTTGIVEFPEQLLLAYYYLSLTFPEAKINTLKEAYEAEIIDDAFIKKYDFILIPIDCFKKIRKGVFNVVVNFNSLGEMSREAFSSYINSDVFKEAEYFFTLNRFESRPTYNTDISILDYKLDEFEKIHFQISPLFGSYRASFLKFFTRKTNFTSQCFEFIGKRKKNS